MYENFRFKKIGDTLFSAELEKQKFEYPSYIGLPLMAQINAE
jgi:hypothetical protein